MSRAERNGTPVAAVGSAAALGVFGFLTGTVVGALILAAVAAAVPDTAAWLPARHAISTVGMGAGLIAVALFYLQSNGLRLSYLGLRWPTGRDLGLAVAVTGVLFATALAVLAVADSLGVAPTTHSVIEQADREPRVLLVLAPLSILVTGPAEELLYRGVIQTRLREAFDAVTTVVVASAIFALVHLPAYAAGGGLDATVWASIGIVFLLGAFLGVAYELTGNLAVPAVAHGLFNAVVFASNYAGAVV